MSIGSIGTLGYDDDQGQRSWDAPGLWWKIQGAQTQEIISPIVDCSRFQNVFTQANLTAGQIRVNFKWYADALGAIGLGTKSLDMDFNYSGTGRIWCVNNGPYVQGTVFNNMPLGPNYTVNLYSNLTNKQMFLPLSPDPGVVVERPLNIAAGGTQTVYPADYYTGEVGVYILTPSQGATVTFNFLTGASGWLPFYSVNLAASAVFYQVMVWPFAACQLLFANPSGVTPSNGGQLTIVHDARG